MLDSCHDAFVPRADMEKMDAPAERPVPAVRVVSIGTRQYTQVVCLDQPGVGGACHEYIVQRVVPPEDSPAGPVEAELATVHFQNGPIKESGVNGCHNEDLMAIVIDRLRHFQAGEFNCRENALALTHMEEALHWLRHRTAARVARGVEGTHEV